MNMLITPQPLAGRIDPVMSSKSQAHRLLICAALADGPTELSNVGFSADVEATLRCLRALGTQIETDADTLRIVPVAHIQKGALLDCGESGSTLRFLLPVSASLGAECAFTGQGKLSQRPLSPLYEEMQAHGAMLSARGCFPLRCGGVLQPGCYTLAGNVSSQFISGLLMALPRLAGDSVITVTGKMESRPYIDMTLDALRQFSIRVDEIESGFFIPGGQFFRSPGRMAVEGDWSGAAFWLTAGALSGKGISCGPLRLDSAQGDRAISDLLRRFGAVVSARENSVFVQRGALQGMNIDISQIPDLAPVLAVAAAFARGQSVLQPIARLRLKESDRVNAILKMLCSLGVSAEAKDDRLVIEGRGAVTGGTVDGFHDHRIVLAASIAAAWAEEPVTVLGTEAVSKSYPGFFDQFAALGGQAKEI